MKICMLASGSEGNCTYIETEKIKLLVDLGTTCKYITEKLSELSIDTKDINYILISHTHSDHVKAIKGFIKKNTPTILITRKMYEELPELKDYEHIIFCDNEDIFLDDLTINIIETSHDATDARSFVFKTKDKSVVYLTDTGYINKKYFKTLYDKNIYLFESNHDVEMLMNGPYPQWLKSRIIGAYGHLSNKDSSIYLAKLIGPSTKKIILTHLSQHNNSEELALGTIQEIFEEYNVKFDNIKCARQKEKSELIEL